MSEHPGPFGRDASSVTARQFDFYLYENFDPDACANHPLNPRRVLTSALDGMLSMAAGGCSWRELCARCGGALVKQAADCGVLRRDGDAVRFDAPIFLREDAAVLSAAFTEEAERLADRLAFVWPELTRLAESLRNGFDAAENLYHIVCGMTLDGALFDGLSETGAVATSRMHPSGLDYLAVAYERCEELDGLSRGLLCSLNRAIGETCVLQSFGDADGDRFDAYRWYRLREKGGLAGRFAAVQAPEKERLTREARRLVETGSCEQSCLQALEAFGYAKDGRVSVPVYRPSDAGMMDAVAALVQECLLSEVTAILRQGVPDVTSGRHGVPAAETANELYHLLFGKLNEALSRRGMVAPPPVRPGEGRYAQSIMLT